MNVGPQPLSVGGVAAVGVMIGIIVAMRVRMARTVGMDMCRRVKDDFEPSVEGIGVRP
jgi:hypothetical protein